MSIASAIEKLLAHVEWEPIFGKVAFVVSKFFSPENRELLLWGIATCVLLVMSFLVIRWLWRDLVPRHEQTFDGSSNLSSEISNSAIPKILKIIPPLQLAFIAASLFGAWVVVLPTMEGSPKDVRVASQDGPDGGGRYCLSENGDDANTEFNLGLRYETAEGVQQDYANAAKCYRLSADQNNARAQNNLGNLYYNGNGVPQSYAEALKLYQLAADQGNADAQFNLGTMYDIGQNVRKDEAEALKWYFKAADQGYAGAQFNLGAMYSNGEGVPRDAVLAHMWLDLAANGVETSDIRRHDKYVNFRDSIAKKMTPGQVVEAQHRATEWAAAHPNR